MRILGILGLMVGMATFAFAGGPTAPEIDGNTAVSALALVSGGLLVLRTRKK